jgi:hypothetical protein
MIVWNKFDDNFQSSDDFETPEHDLLIMTSNSKGTKISKVDTEAILKVQRDVSTDAFFMHPLFPGQQVTVGYMVDTFKSEFAEFDRDLRGGPHLTKANNVGIKKGYSLKGFQFNEFCCCTSHGSELE